METTLTETMVPMKIKDVVVMLMQRNNYTAEQALQYIYSSKLYQILKNEDSKLWYQSSEMLYSLLVEEKLESGVSHKLNDKEILFITFCIENYAKYKTNGQVEIVLSDFSRYGIYAYLSNNFEILHSQGTQYIIDTIETYIKNRR